MVKFFAVGLIYFGVAYGFMSLALNTPQGYYNAVSGKCIAVLTASGVVPCKGAPRHETVYVSPSLTYEALRSKYSR